MSPVFKGLRKEMQFQIKKKIIALILARGNLNYTKQKHCIS